MERILCAAIYYDDGKDYTHMPRNTKTGITVCGRRHHNCYTILDKIFPGHEYLTGDVQGFLTSEDRFVDREEAFLIADAAGQIIPEERARMNQRTNKNMELFSEHLY